MSALTLSWCCGLWLCWLCWDCVVGYLKGTLYAQVCRVFERFSHFFLVFFSFIFFVFFLLFFFFVWLLFLFFFFGVSIKYVVIAHYHPDKAVAGLVAAGE